MAKDALALIIGNIGKGMKKGEKRKDDADVKSMMDADDDDDDEGDALQDAVDVFLEALDSGDSVAVREAFEAMHERAHEVM